jgi:hypothetical protein
MELSKWIGNCKIRSFPWIDGKRIYFNVMYYLSGQSIEHVPTWDKTIYITNNPAGHRLVYEFTDSLVNYVKSIIIPKDSQFTITVE